MAMQTKIMHQGAATAWLETYTATGSRPEVTSLETFPFVVGRSQSCSLSIDSHRVSREHALIEPSGDELILRDLASTNGTFLNGQRIDSAPLSDGDLLVFADTEFSFRCPSQSPREAVTEVLNATAASTGDTATGWDVIREVRRLHERATQSACQTRFEAIVELHSRSTFGYQTIREDGCRATGQVVALLQSTECRLLAGLAELARAVAVQDAAQLPGPAHLFLPLESFEVGVDDLPASLDRLRRAKSSDKELVVEIPASAACDIPYFRELLKTIRQLGIAVAYGGFSGGRTQMQQFCEIAPDYVKLSRSTTHELARHVNQQRQLQAIAKAAAEIDCDLIAVDVRSPNTADVCRDLGCRFAQGLDTTGADSQLGY